MTVKTNSGYNNYYFRKNIFGDILAVYNSSKTVLATYTYDAFGNASVTYANVQKNLARLNPFRYRGYYWDEEIELYYVQKRYYDPEVGRFISPDSIENINPNAIFGLNLYAYCYNNPIGIVYGRGGVVGNVRNVVGSASFFVNPNGLSIVFSLQNWIATGTDLSASLISAINIIWWIKKNSELYEFLKSAYGVSKYEVLTNLKSPLTKLATAVSYGLVAFDTIMDVIGHINAGDSWQTTVASGVTTAGIGVFNVWASAKIGAAVGGLIGGPVGYLVGIGVGAIVGVVINGIFYIEIDGKSIAGYIEDGIRWLFGWLT